MNKWLLLMACVLPAHLAPAQLVKELLQQKKTQLAYLSKQIAALQGYAALGKSGYSVVSDGIRMVGVIKSSETGLHRAFFNHQNTVSNGVAHDFRILEIISLQVEIAQQWKHCFAQLRRHPPGSWEPGYAERVFGALMKGCARDIGSLSDLVSPGKLALGEEERRRRIGSIYQDVMQRYIFTRHFTGAMEQLEQQQPGRKAGIKTLQWMYQVNNQ